MKNRFAKCFKILFHKKLIFSFNLCDIKSYYIKNLNSYKSMEEKGLKTFKKIN